MSTKTTFKRIALVTVAALGFGLLSSVTPASAVATALTASVGPNGATSLTVVGGDSSTAGALIRLNVTNSDAGTPGLGVGDTVTASVTAPALRNGGSVADTSTAVGGVGTGARSDFIMLESVGQATGALGATAASAVSSATNWTRLASGTQAAGSYLDSATAGMGTEAAHARAADGKIGSENTGFLNMDTTHELTDFGYIKSYYVTVRARSGADIMDKGAYTFAFQLTDVDGVVRGNASVKIDFVSAAATSGAVLALSTSGTFLANTAVATYDSTSATWVKATLTNREGGLVRTHLGANVVPTVRQQFQTTAAPTWTDTGTVTINDSGTYGSDFGTGATGNPLGSSTNRGFDGVYGVAFTTGEASSATTGRAYRMWAAYGNATIVTAAFTVYGSSVATGLLANPALTTVVATASGMLAGEEAAVTLSTSKNYTVPTTTKTATLKFTINSASATPVGGALITVKPTWTGPIGSANVSPATSTTGTVYTTDALGNFSVTVTNSSPIDTAKVTLVLSGEAAFGAGTNTVSVTFAAPVATSIAIADPIDGISVLSGAATVTTAIVKDQFGNPVKDQVVTVSTSQTPAVVSTTVIAPLTTNAEGTVSYSFTPAAASTAATVSFNTAPTALTAASRSYTYVATLPVVATLTAYHGLAWGAAATLTPSTGIYSSGTNKLILNNARNISKPLTVDSGSTSDEISLRFTALTAAGVSATGASVTVTAGEGGHIVGVSGLPVKSRTYSVGATGTAVINVLATGTGAITFTATSGTVTATAAMWVAGVEEAAGRFITVTSAATGVANGSGTPVTVAVTDRYGNPVSGVSLNVVASGVGSFMGGNITQSFTTDASGSYTFLANTAVSAGGVAKFTATTGSTAVGFGSAAGYHNATEVDATLAAGNKSAFVEITFAPGASASDIAQAAADAAAEAIDAGNNANDSAVAATEAAEAAAAAAEEAGERAVAAAEAASAAAVEAAQAATDAANEALDAANAATDAANASAEAADAATAAAQDAADAVAALSTQVSEMINALKRQITSLTNLVIKIQKKVKA